MTAEIRAAAGLPQGLATLNNSPANYCRLRGGRAGDRSIDCRDESQEGEMESRDLSGRENMTHRDRLEQEKYIFF